jgi:hypothetical protein
MQYSYDDGVPLHGYRDVGRDPDCTRQGGR